MTTFLVVTPSETAVVHQDGMPLMKAMSQGDLFFALDRNVCFLRTSLDLESLTAALHAQVTDGLFFVTELDEAGRSGNMMPAFWDFLRSADAQLPSAAA